MSPKHQTRKSGWKPPRDRREVVVAVLASLAVIVATATLVWFVRPNRDSGTTVSPTLPAVATTTAPATTAPAAPTTAPAPASSPAP